MGIRSYLGFGSSTSSSGSSDTSTRTSGGSTGGWYDPNVPLPQVREVHPAPAATDRLGRRVNSVDPYDGPGKDSTRRNFGRPYRED